METSLIGKAVVFGANEYGFESLVSNILINLNNLITFYNNIQKQNKLNYFIYLKKNLIKFLKFFKYLGLVNNFFFVKKINNFYIFKVKPFFFKNICFIKKIILISKNSKRIFLSKYGLQLLNKYKLNLFFCLSTPYGLYNNFAYSTKLTGGILLFYILL